MCSSLNPQTHDKIAFPDFQVGVMPSAYIEESPEKFISESPIRLLLRTLIITSYTDLFMKPLEKFLSGPNIRNNSASLGKLGVFVLWTL